MELYGHGVGNGHGRLGQNTTTYFSSPVQIPGTSWSSISAGGNHSLATKTDGTLWSWGSNSLWKLGQNNTTNVSSPVQIPGTSWSSISAGRFHSLATKTDGTLWSWGYNALDN
jgi:alpha-tubulin suppressor-like RCC1 family protein